MPPIQTSEQKIHPPVFITILILLAGIFGFIKVYGYLHTSTFPRKDQPSPSTFQLADWKTYRNEQYGFEIYFPDDWNDYKVIPFREEGKSGIMFCLPTIDKNYPDSLCKKDLHASMFVLYVYAKEQWDQINPDLKDTIFSQNQKYIITYRKAQDNPDDLLKQYREINQILSTFKFIK